MISPLSYKILRSNTTLPEESKICELLGIESRPNPNIVLKFANATDLRKFKIAIFKDVASIYFWRGVSEVCLAKILLDL